MQEYLHITPKNDAEGILQDVHWSDGSFGYFPSYLLGSIYDGMYLEKMEEELGSVDEILADGRIGEITKWLNEKIHWYGSTRTPKEVIAAVCGKEVSAQPLVLLHEEKIHETVWTFRGSLDKRERTGDDVMKRGIIFDMDGTLWDSAENVAKSWNVAIRQYGVREKELTTQDIQGVMGKTMDVIADILFAEFPEEKRETGS